MKPKLALAALLVLVTVGANATNRRLIAVEKRLDEELGKPTDIGTITTLKTDNEILATEVGHLKDRTAALEKRVTELEKQYRYPECVTLVGFELVIIILGLGILRTMDKILEALKVKP